MRTDLDRTKLLALVLFCLGATAGWSETPYISTAGLAVSNYSYQEEGVKQTGTMGGVNLSFHKFIDSIYWNTDLTLEAGRAKYTSRDTGKSGNDSNLMIEVRVVAGTRFPNTIGDLQAGWSVIPYAGLAYRYLGNDSSGDITNTNDWGYDRRSNYLYSPVGFEVTRRFGEGWSFTTKAEFDAFWAGRQVSYLSPTITNRQSSGYGARGSLVFRHRGAVRDFTIEPFITYWNIGKSSVVEIDTTSGAYFLWEPQNTTTEIGCKFGFGF